MLRNFIILCLAIVLPFTSSPCTHWHFYSLLYSHYINEHIILYSPDEHRVVLRSSLGSGGSGLFTLGRGSGGRGFDVTGSGREGDAISLRQLFLLGLSVCAGMM